MDVAAADDGDGSAPSDRLVLGMPAADTAAAIREHPATTAEVRQLCGDLQVLGRSEFKALLKWCAASLAAHHPCLPQPELSPLDQPNSTLRVVR